MKDGSAFLNERANTIADGMVHEAERLRIAVAKGPLDCRLIDAGAKVRGSIEAGLRIAEICMGGLGTVKLAMGPSEPWALNIEVRSSQPVLACLGSQYAGWNLSEGKYFAMGSGPVRVLAGVEPLFEILTYREQASHSVVVLETADPPPEALVRKVSKASGVTPENLTFIYAPTQSLAGTIQIVARVLEVALHKAKDIDFPIDDIVEGIARAPVPAPHPDFMQAMGRTNDAIIYGGLAQLFVTGPLDAARELAQKLPSSSSRDYGEPFTKVFERFKGDFYAIDPLLFSPAEVIVTSMETGETFRTGARDFGRLDWGQG
ncbi:methenyltetrahydromethanopterin cyclohydrolase [Nitratireductor aestuarii]|uniref:Methenyltetrahydromethanopterin cyclohydrolase n=1 Tax=Nitratireductor aestuarii TaxID=1735103 RepID=A0A916W0Z4_9HYPH|nr:methenyltetrahydromethanopterin cyclohydrolase [Nitratireductor aestuarii]GGA58883.1 methenyltetrahydromethanopterin cyclohydrolase [Nitratireductor aestuarii]